jgi:hypothetical protein
VLRLLARGARPARAIVGGQGLDALDAETGRTDGYRRLLAAVADGSVFKPGSPEEGLAGWLAQTGADPRATAGELAALLPNGQPALVPGDHITALGAPEFADAIANFLG